MEFGAADSEIEIVYRDFLRSGAADADYDLRTTRESQGAGLIDDHIRVSIRESRFVVADISTGNRGAYWESGFAEGLGKPVIYTCKKSVWDDKGDPNRPHFDTNHLHTIVWDPDNLPAARRQLADAIRNTFPDDHKPADDPT